MSRKLVKFVILFDNTNVLYFPGQFLSGRVIVELNDDTPALGLHFHVVGEGVVRPRNRKQDKNYERENYIDFRMRLLGEPGKVYIRDEVGPILPTPFDPNEFLSYRQPPLLLSPGIHSFPFKLGLPLGLPSTFFGKNGWVQYFCKAALREPNGLTHKNQQVFIVMNPIDLNSEPSVLEHAWFNQKFDLEETRNITTQPFRCDMEHKFGVSCLKSGSVLCRVVLNHGGYVPGETILVSAIIRNRSKIHIRSTKASLRETIEYMVKNKVAHSETRELSSVKRGKILSGEVDEWRNEQLPVPPLPPTNLRGCHIISVQYDVYFIIEPKGLEKEVKIQLPILLGTYPFQSDEFDSRKPEAHYPTTLPIFRPWLEHKSH